MSSKTINVKVSECIKSIGEDLIARADDIARDLRNVTSININSKISYDEIINYDITKNYYTEALIDNNVKENGTNFMKLIEVKKMKDIDNVVFTDEILEKYKDDSKMITELCKKLDENRKVQEEYKKFLKGV